MTKQETINPRSLQTGPYTVRLECDTRTFTDCQVGGGTPEEAAAEALRVSSWLRWQVDKGGPKVVRVLSATGADVTPATGTARFSALPVRQQSIASGSHQAAEVPLFPVVDAEAGRVVAYATSAEEAEHLIRVLNAYAGHKGSTATAVEAEAKHAKNLRPQALTLRVALTLERETPLGEFGPEALREAVGLRLVGPQLAGPEHRLSPFLARAGEVWWSQLDVAGDQLDPWADGAQRVTFGQVCLCIEDRLPLSSADLLALEEDVVAQLQGEGSGRPTPFHPAQGRVLHVEARALRQEPL